MRIDLETLGWFCAGLFIGAVWYGEDCEAADYNYDLYPGYADYEAFHDRKGDPVDFSDFPDIEVGEPEYRRKTPDREPGSSLGEYIRQFEEYKYGND